MEEKNGALIQLVQEMQSALKDIQTIRERVETLEDLERDPLLLRAARDAAFVAIQSAIDMGNRIISLKGYRKPETYRDTFSVLTEEGVLSPDLCNQLQDLASFRNALVHFYWKFQRERLLKFIKDDPGILKEFLKRIWE